MIGGCRCRPARRLYASAVCLECPTSPAVTRSSLVSAAWSSSPAASLLGCTEDCLLCWPIAAFCFWSLGPTTGPQVTGFIMLLCPAAGCLVASSQQQPHTVCGHAIGVRRAGESVVKARTVVGHYGPFPTLTTRIALGSMSSFQNTSEPCAWKATNTRLHRTSSAVTDGSNAGPTVPRQLPETALTNFTDEVHFTCHFTRSPRLRRHEAAASVAVLSTRTTS